MVVLMALPPRRLLEAFRSVSGTVVFLVVRSTVVLAVAEMCGEKGNQ